jgi:hypothetical protein
MPHYCLHMFRPPNSGWSAKVLLKQGLGSNEKAKLPWSTVNALNAPAY